MRYVRLRENRTGSTDATPGGLPDRHDRQVFQIEYLTKVVVFFRERAVVDFVTARTSRFPKHKAGNLSIECKGLTERAAV